MRRAYVGSFLTVALVMISYGATYRVVAQMAGPTGFGEYALARRTLAFISPLCTLGTDFALARYVALTVQRDRPEAETLFAVSLVVLGATSTVIVAMFIILQRPLAIALFGDADFVSLVPALTVVIVGGGLHSLAYNYLRGMSRFLTANVLMALNYAVIPILTAVAFGRSVTATLWSMGLGWLGVSAVCASLLPRSWARPRLRLRQILRYGLPRAPGDLIQLGLMAAPGILLSHSSTIEVAGVAAFGIAGLGLLANALNPISFILLPVSTTLLAAGDMRALRRHVFRVVVFVAVAAVVVLVAAEVFADRLLLIFLGGRFTAAASTIRWVMLAAPPYALYVTLKSVVDARHVRAVNTRNLALAAVAFAVLVGVMDLWAKLNSAVILGCFDLSIGLVGGLTAFEVLRIIRGPAAAEFADEADVVRGRGVVGRRLE
jgi:O-antigen/teichoic acid export membrane protein